MNSQTNTQTSLVLPMAQAFMLYAAMSVIVVLGGYGIISCLSGPPPPPPAPLKSTTKIPVNYDHPDLTETR